MPWLAVSVELERASAEAFSEALLAAGARSVSVENPEDARPRLTALLDASADAAAFVAKAAGTAALRDLPAFRITSVADAPSESCDELPAVTLPAPLDGSKYGFTSASPSNVVSGRLHSSCSNQCSSWPIASPVFLSRIARTTFSGAISSL